MAHTAATSSTEAYYKHGWLSVSTDMLKTDMTEYRYRIISIEWSHSDDVTEMENYQIN